jgi:hypothetical protein
MVPANLCMEISPGTFVISEKMTAAYAGLANGQPVKQLHSALYDWCRLPNTIGPYHLYCRVGVSYARQFPQSDGSARSDIHRLGKPSNKGT